MNTVVLVEVKEGMRPERPRLASVSTRGADHFLLWTRAQSEKLIKACKAVFDKSTDMMVFYNAKLRARWI